LAVGEDAIAGTVKEMLTTLTQGVHPASPPGRAQSANPLSKLAAPASTLETACRHCASTDLRMVYGGGSRPYYFRCEECAKSTPTQWTCPSCGGEARIRKSGLQFTRWCKDPACGAEELVFSNPG
jgi:hypothetical protein